MTDFTDLIDVAAERLGGSALLANDEFFGPKERSAHGGAARMARRVYDEHGKWMDAGNAPAPHGGIRLVHR